MRDLLFKNLTSGDKRKKIISSYEIADNQGVRSVIRRHFVCLIKEVNKKNQVTKPLPYIYVLKEHNHKDSREKFFCRIKGSVYAASKNKLYLVLFMHSLKISLAVTPDDLMKYN